MSDQLTSQSRPSSGISRRTALRGAAWSASAVTVVVATPNIAAATSGAAIVPTGTVESTGTAVKYGESVKYVAWDIKVTCNNMDLSGLQLRLTYDQNGGGSEAKLADVEVESFSPTARWSSTITKDAMVATVSASYAGPDIVRGVPVNIHIRFRGTDNSKGRVGVTVMARDSRGDLVSVGTIAPEWWTAGSEHTH